MRYKIGLIAAVAIVLAATSSVFAQETPTIIKDWVKVQASTVNNLKGDWDKWSWVPAIDFRVNGPIESGSQLYVEFSYPGATSWVKFDCDTGPIQKGRWWNTSCGGRDIPEEKSTLYTGPVTFAIKMRNELAGTDSTIFTGKAKVGKVKSNEQGPKAVNKFVYYVDHDAELPVGYVFLTPDDVDGWKRTHVNVAFWVRGEGVRMDPHLFFQGKEVGKLFYEGQEVGKPGCDSEIDINTTHFVDDSVPQKAKWSRVRCSFPSILGADTTGDGPSMFGRMYELSKNPGEYEFKLLWNNKLSRSVKFTVNPGGSFDNGIATSNKLGEDRVIVPVTVLGDQDGIWNKTAWKTDGFYGNPLTGFTAMQ